MLRHSFITYLTAGTLAVVGCAEPVMTPTGSVELVEAVTLTAPAGSSDLHGSAPARSSAGYFAARTFAGRGGGIAIFDSAGTLMAELDGEGRGPGEFSDLRAVAFGPGDTLWALETARAQAFSPPPAVRFVRSVTFLGVGLSQVTPVGFLTKGLTSFDGAHQPTLRDWDGAILATFPSPDDASSEEARMGPVAFADPTSIWFGNGTRYSLSRLQAGGEVAARIRRDVEWFSPDEAYRGSLNAVRPPTRLQMLAVDPQARVLALSRRAHRDWAPTGSGPAAVERKSDQAPAVEATRARPSLADWGKLFEFVLEVFDANGQLVASRVLDDGMQGLVGGTQVYQVVADSVGLISLRIWNIRVSAGSASR